MSKWKLIKEHHLASLLRSEYRLDVLYENGVDQWEGYTNAISKGLPPEEESVYGNDKMSDEELTKKFPNLDIDLC